MERVKNKIAGVVFAFIFLMTSCKEKGLYSNEYRIEINEILWDTWGVPHIYANSQEMLYYMAGRAQMKNHANLILKLYGEARAKSYMYWGRDKNRDIYLEKFRFPEHAARIAREMPDDEKLMINAFVKGINEYAQENPEQINNSIQQVLPIKTEDVIGHFLRLFYYEFLINRKLAGTEDWQPGSNAWALRNERTAENATYLLTNPHLPWMDFWMLFECQYITQKNILYGVTLVGLPTIGIGFNKNLGWTHTVNTVDNVDFFEVQTKGDSEYQYLNGSQSFKIDSFSIDSKNGKDIQHEKFARKTSELGIVLKENGEKALIIKFPDLSGAKSVFGQWKQMGAAKNLKEFESAIALNHLPLFNIIYADRQNNILYHFGGKVPKKKGPWEQWQSKIAVANEDYNWKSLYSYNEVPHLLNPENNWLQNANDPPFTSTIPQEINYKDYDAAMSPIEMSLRAQRSALLIGDKENVSFDDFIKLKFDTKSQLALRLRDELIALKDEAENNIVKAALNVLEGWNGSFESDSEGAVLFTNFINEIKIENIDRIFEKPWSPEKPLQTPDGIKNKEEVLAALVRASEKQLDQYGSLAIKFGELYRMKVGKYDYPSNGGFGHLGIFRTMTYRPGGDNKNYVVHGDTYVSAVSFGDTIKARAIMAYGNATEQKSPHVGDQLELFSKKQLREVWLDRHQHEKNLEKTEKF